MYVGGGRYFVTMISRLIHLIGFLSGSGDLHCSYERQKKTILKTILHSILLHNIVRFYVSESMLITGPPFFVPHYPALCSPSSLGPDLC